MKKEYKWRTLEPLKIVVDKAEKDLIFSNELSWIGKVSPQVISISDKYSGITETDSNTDLDTSHVGDTSLSSSHVSSSRAGLRVRKAATL